MTCARSRLPAGILGLIAEKEIDRPEWSVSKVHKLCGVGPKHQRCNYSFIVITRVSRKSVDLIEGIQHLLGWISLRINTDTASICCCPVLFKWCEMKCWGDMFGEHRLHDVNNGPMVNIVDLEVWDWWIVLRGIWNPFLDKRYCDWALGPSMMSSKWICVIFQVCADVADFTVMWKIEFFWCVKCRVLDVSPKSIQLILRLCIWLWILPADE